MDKRPRQRVLYDIMKNKFRPMRRYCYGQSSWAATAGLENRKKWFQLWKEPHLPKAVVSSSRPFVPCISVPCGHVMQGIFSTEKSDAVKATVKNPARKKESGFCPTIYSAVKSPGGNADAGKINEPWAGPIYGNFSRDGISRAYPKSAPY